MRKIVIHEGIGGFSLSYQAIMRLRDLGNKEALDIDLKTLMKISSSSDYNFPIARDNPQLVQVVKELGGHVSLGGKVEGSSSHLKIVEIPEDVEWDISENHGDEWIFEKHRTWS